MANNNNPSTKKKLLVIMNQLQRPGGTQRISTDLIAELTKYAEVTAIVLEGTDIQYPLPESVTLLKLSDIDEESSRIKKALNTFQKIRRVSRIIKELQPDTVLSFLPRSNIANILGRKYSKVNYRCVIVEHNFNSINYEKSFTGRLFLAQLKRLYPKADIVIPNAYKLGDELVDNFGVEKDRVKMIANPYRIKDIENRSKEAIDDPRFAGDDYFYINVARFIEQKNLPLLLEAFHDVRKQTPVKLLLMGRGEEGQRMLEAKTKELGLTEDVIFMGWQKNPFKYMRRANAFILSSIFEGAPNVLYESMICETPIVSTDCPSGPAEILEGGHCGVLVPMRNRKALADAMLDIKNDSAKAKDIADKARKAVEKYQLENIGEEYRKVLFD